VPLQTSIPIPGPAQRTPVTQSWQSGYKAIDAFYPLKRGEFTVVAGEKDLSHHDVALSATITALLSSPGSLGVLCFVGLSRKALKQAVAQVSAAGLDTRVTVVAATGSFVCFSFHFCHCLHRVHHATWIQRKIR
jgi:F0F1-type ATP synthase alpha subunit